MRAGGKKGENFLQAKIYGYTVHMSLKDLHGLTTINLVTQIVHMHNYNYPVRMRKG